MEIKRDHTVITINTRMFDNSGNLYPAFNRFTTSVFLVNFSLVMSESVCLTMKKILIIIPAAFLFIITGFKISSLETDKNKPGNYLDRHDEVLNDLEILCVKRAWPDGGYKKDKHDLRNLGFPSNHECQSSLRLNRYQNEIGILNPVTREFRPIFKPDGSYFVGQIDLHWDGDRMLFVKSDSINWKIFEMNIDGTGLRQVSQAPDDVDCFEPCYLPDGRIMFNSNAGYQSVPCWHGEEEKYTASLYIMNADGSGMRRVAFDQDHDFHPAVRHNGQVVYARWDYTGINRLFLRPLMTMNPDGTNQRSIYGSNSWFPNGLYYPKELPGENGRFLCILSGYHGSFRSGVLSIVDINKGRMEDEGITMLSGKETPIEVKIEDEFTGKIWPQYVTPYPVTNEYFLASAWVKESDTKIGMYMADIHNNITLIHEEEKTAFIEPIPIKKRQLPAILPDRVDLEKTDATIYIQDIFEGDGLKDVPRDAVKELRVIAYDFGYIGSAGTDNIGISGPWEAMRILGIAPVEKDGSAIFKVPANTPIAFQPLDEDGAAVQLMRSWTTAMPGERLSCIGCHESGFTVPLPKASIASRKEPAELKPWYGPERGFDFEREVQPVLNRYCTGCHNQDHTLDLRAESHFPDYEGTKPGRLDFLRLHPQILEKYNGKVLFTPTYEKLISYIRRVNVADDVSMLEPGEYHANTSELIQLLREGHQGVELDEESWSRLITWIDLNGPCHGTYQDIFNEPIPENPNERRWELALAYGGPNINPDFIPEGPFYDDTPVLPNPDKKSEIEAFTKKYKRKKLKHRELRPGTGETLKLVNFGGDYWIGTHEITNAQFRQFDPSHSSRYYGKRHEGRADGKGLPLDESDQPAIRVSWDRAMAYCEWLSDKTGYQVTLPTEDQWELACMGGNKGFYHYKGEDFSSWENMADRTFTTFGFKGRSLDGHFVVGGDGCLIDAEGVKNADRRYDDGGCVTMPVGSYKPNGFGLYDMHGNAAEWTSTGYEYEARAGRSRHFQYVVKGGSFLDRPERAHVKVRHGYPSWQNVYNAGFRIVIYD